MGLILVVACPLAVAVLLGIVYSTSGYPWRARARVSTGVYADKIGPAWARTINHKDDVSAIARVGVGDSVALLWDEYEKDYWACYIRTVDGIRGWVLCTDFDRN